MSGERAALNIVNKINSKLKVLYRKNSILAPALWRLLCNELMQPHFNYTCSTWYRNLTKKLMHRVQTTQNKYMSFCLQLDRLKHISHEEPGRLNWLPVTYTFKQCVNAMVFKYFNEQCLNYLNEVFHVGIENNFQLFLNLLWFSTINYTQFKWKPL